MNSVSQNWMNYHHLYYFKTIAETGSVSGAAELLRLGQPTLSAQLKQFEDVLGVQLFERQHKKLILTEQGKLALDYAQTIFKLGSEMQDAIHDRLTPQRLNLQIGAIDGLAKEIILAISKEAFHQAPCSISLIEGRPEDMLRELTSHRIDLFVTNFIPNHLDSKKFSYKAIAKNQIRVFGSPQFKNLKNKFPASLSGKSFILPTYDSRIRQDFDHWAKTNNLPVDVIAETQDDSLKKLMAADGLGLIPSTAANVENYLKNKSLIEIGPVENVFEDIYLISAQRKLSNPIAQKLMKGFKL